MRRNVGSRHHSTLLVIFGNQSCGCAQSKIALLNLSPPARARCRHNRSHGEGSWKRRWTLACNGNSARESSLGQPQYKNTVSHVPFEPCRVLKGISETLDSIAKLFNMELYPYPPNLDLRKQAVVSDRRVRGERGTSPGN
jgi:hypothetical protein